MKTTKRKRYKFVLIADSRWMQDIIVQEYVLCWEDLKEEIERQKEMVRKSKNIKYEFFNERKLTFLDGKIQQMRVNVIGETMGTWNDVYTIVNSIRAQKIEKLEVVEI